MNESANGESVDILYGKSGLRVRMPRDARVTVIGKHPMPKLPDPHAAVRDALAHPIGAAPYATLVRGRRSACILICDITRPVPNHLFLRPLIEGLLAAGMAREAITVLVATGLHRPNEGAELAEVVGDPLGARHGSRREPLRARRRGARRFRRHPRAAHAGEARPPLRRGGPAHRDRAGRAAFHGRLLGRPQGHRAGDRPRRHDPHVPQRALHGRPGGDPVQSAGQPAARGAARDRADAGRGVRAQHGDRRGSRSRPRQLRRGDREPSHRGRVRRRAARACPSAGAFRRS